MDGGLVLIRGNSHKKKQRLVMVSTDGAVARRCWQSSCLDVTGLSFVSENHDGPASLGVKNFIGSSGILMERCVNNLKAQWK